MLIVLVFIVAVIYASFFEWKLHKDVMHRPFLGFRYAYKAHALTHHGTFRFDRTYHLQRESDKYTIPMAWWNGPVLVLISCVPFDLIGWYLGTWTIPLTAMGTVAVYYGTYEYIHWCMHLPRKRSVERTGVFFKLNGHHVLHHRYPDKNLNVVLPLADLCLGTLLLRSKIPFNQVRGEMVPDLQPPPSQKTIAHS
ncbi:MAG: sterol desaturase family protein [bacterium]|nr:sterol desaturase family protein [bacterium]